MSRLAFFLICIATLHSAFAQEDAEDTLGIHVVQPGESLWSITKKYLGEDFLWRENWKLNPDIENPHQLRIGQRLVVITERVIPAKSADIQAVANRVEKNLKRQSWLPAAAGDQLFEEDGLRTLRKSSAQLGFNDATTLRLTEYSQLFLSGRETTLRGVDRANIEVTKGTAEIEFAPLGNQKTEIEVLVGRATANPRPDSAGNGQLRASNGTDDSAQLMVYAGSSSVASQGQTVQIAKGEGASVPKTGKIQVEKLLPAPLLEDDKFQGTWPIANVPLRWQTLPEADQYVIEVCEDKRCGRLHDRASIPAQPNQDFHNWTPEMRAAGNYHWRVTAVSNSGIQGYPSEAKPFRLERLVRDEAPPVVAIVPIGYAKLHDPGKVRIGPNTQIKIVGFDADAGVAELQWRWQGGQWQIAQRSEVNVTLPTQIPDSQAILQVMATDYAGLSTDVISHEIRVLGNPVPKN